MEKLSRSSSGVRHLRWGREILATMRAQDAVNARLPEAQKTVLQGEITKVAARVDTLAKAVGPYRDFIDSAHVDVRAKQRVANYLCDEAQRDADSGLKRYKHDIDTILPGGFSAILAKTPLSRVLKAGHEKTVEFAERAAGMVRSLPASIPGTGAIADTLEKAAELLRGFNEEARKIEEQRQPLKAAVNKAIFELREELDQVDGRLRSSFSQLFIDSLYPELTRKGSTVADEDDEDDDTSAAPEK